MRRLAWFMFVVSGVAGLVFEVALQRSLTRVFGVSAFATSTVLAAWMAGLALGALAFGRLADRVRSPLKLYAWLELGIAAVAIGAPQVTPKLPALFASLAHGLPPDDSRLLLGRLAMAFVLTMVPTVLMGGTLPAVARGLSNVQGVAHLYTANLLGAAAGAGLTSYLLLPSLGLAHTQYLGATLNVIAAVLAFALPAPTQTTNAQHQPAASGETAAMPLLFALAGWSGFVTFCAEVTWFHLLAVVVGNSAYAFGAMLATFLTGLALGSAWLANRATITVALAGRVQLAAAFAFALSLPLWEHVPNLFLLAAPKATTFASREAVRAFACAYMLLFPSGLLGVIFPMTLRLAPTSARDIGRLSALNTVAAVVASLLTGFLLLPALGSQGTIILLAVGSCVTAALLLPRRWLAAPAVVALMAFVMPKWNLGVLASGINVYFDRGYYSGGEVVWSGESVEAGLTTVVKQDDVLTMLTNGKFQGNNAGEVEAQRAFAQLPMLVQHHWGSALVIGLGTACSLGETARQPWRELEVIELGQDIIDAAREYFGPVNGDVLRSGRVKETHADARNALLLSSKKYDLIGMEISSIWFAGAADLYGREFNAIVRDHLAPGGIFQQWVQFHHLTRRDFAVILATLRTEFPHVAVFFRGGQGMVLASAEPLWVDYAAVSAMVGTPPATDVPANDPLMLAGDMVLDLRGVDELIEQERRGLPMNDFISTDDSLYLEFSTPRGNADPNLEMGALLLSLRGLSAQPLELRGADDTGRLHAAAALQFGLGNGVEGARLAELAGPRAQHLLEWARRQTP